MLNFPSLTPPWGRRRLHFVSTDDQLPQRPLDDASAPPVAENADALAIKRSPLADPKFGLVWSNSSVSDEVLVRAAIKHGAFHLLLEAALHHGLPFVEQQLALMMEDEDAALTDECEAEVRRKLRNIQRGIAQAERDAQEGCTD